MKIYILSLIAVGIFLNSCSDSNNKTAGHKDANHSYKSDTLEAYTLLKRVNDETNLPTDSLITLLNKVLEISIRTDYLEGKAIALFQLGNISYFKNSYEDALGKYEKALKIAEKTGNKLLNAQCLERMASVHLATDDSHLALKLYYESLEISEDIGDSSGIAKVYNIIGIYKGHTGQYDSAVAYFKKAIDLNEKLQNRLEAMENHGNLAYLYQTHGKTAEAKQIYHSLIDKLVLAKDQINLPVIYFNLASLHQDLNNLDSCNYYLREAIWVAEETKDTAMLASIYGNTGEIMLAKEKQDSARYYFEKSVICAKAIDDAETVIQSLSFLEKMDISTLDYKSALMKSHQILALKDTSFKRKIKNNLETTELQYENEKRKNLIEMQQLTIESAKKTRILYFVLLLISFSVVAMISVVLKMRKNNYLRDKKFLGNQLLLNEMEIDRFQKEEEINRLKMEKIGEEIRVKERELMNIALGIEQKNELLNLIGSKLKESLNQNKDSISESELNKILASIKFQLIESKERDIFNQQFSAIHHDFFSNLKKHHPDLTKVEIKFCAYLRINLSSNQIASILSVTNEAIRKNRYRIRKKMNLTIDQSLEDYISSF